MNKTAYEHLVGLVLNKTAEDPGKYKSREDYIRNGQLGRSLGDTEGAIERAEEWDMWNRSRQVAQATKQNGTYAQGRTMTGTFNQGRITSANGVPVKPAPVKPAPVKPAPVRTSGYVKDIGGTFR